MWKLLGGALAACIIGVLALGLYLSDKIYLRDNHQTIAAGDLSRLYAPDAIRDDVAFLITTLEANHPDFEAVGGNAYKDQASQFAASISEPITRMDVYRGLAPFNQFLRDGHSYLRAPFEERDAYEASGGKYPPFTVRFIETSPHIDRALDESLGLQRGDVLISINGADAAELAEFSLATNSGESIALRSAYAEKFFYRDAWASGLASPFDITAKRDGAIMRATSDGMTREKYLSARSGATGNQNSFRLMKGNIGLLTFNLMPPTNTDFREFIESTFQTIREEEIASLIIDMRENGGGDSRAGDLLMEYLTDNKLPSIDYIDVKVTDDIKHYYQTLLPEGFRWIPLHRVIPLLRQIQDSRSGESFRFRPDSAEPTKRRKKPATVFDGALYVLTGPRTYSSAVIFAAPLKHFSRATFVGRETGEPLIFYGENYYFDLPNTRLEAQVSHKTFVLVGAKDNSTGIIPDIPVQGDALAATLEVIESQR